MLNECRVYDSQGVLIRVHSAKELGKRADEILKIGYWRAMKSHKQKPRICKNCKAEYQGYAMYKYCEQCRATKKHNKKSIPDTDCLIP